MNIAQLLANAARSKGEHGALSIGSRQVATYATLARHVSGLATSLRGKLELQPGDRVGIVMTNTPEYIEVLFAVWWAGLIAVPINARLHAREIAYILESADARACFTNKEIEDVVGPLQGKGALKFVISVDGAEYRKLTGADGMTLTPAASDAPAGYSTPAARQDAPRAPRSPIAT